MATVFFRTIIMYVLVIAAIRLMGKRQVGELEVSELVITFMLSELAVLPISDKKIPILQTLIPIITLLSAEVILSFATSKSALCKKIFLGRPSVIIKKGVLNQKELSRLRMSTSELLSELRLKGASSISEVEYAIIEDNGQLSVIKKENYSPVTPDFEGKNAEEKGISHGVIIEGKIYRENLNMSGKSENWLRAQLSKRKVQIKDIYLMTVDDNGNVFIITKTKEKKEKKEN